MNYIELFAGIGGFRSALDKLGFDCVFSSEIDKYAKKSYQALYGHEPSGDITKIHAEDIPDHDLIVGGFPCQAFSIAGQRKGFDDTRGTLFYEIVRIADYKQPKWLMLENVKGLLSHDGGRTFDIMCACLNDIGYAVDFKVLNSKHYGVPQNRERIFIMASRDAEHEDWHIDGSDVVAKAKRRIAKLGIKTFNFDFPNNKTVDKRLRDVLQSDVPEKFYLSKEKTEKLIHQLNDKTKNDIAAINTKNEDGGQYYFQDRIFHEKGVMPALTSFTQNVMQEPQGEIVKLFDIPRDIIADNELQRRVYSTEGISPCANARTDSAKIAIEVRPVLTPDREEKSQNGRRFKENDEEAFTLTTQDVHGVAIREATKIGYAIAEDGDSVNIVHPDSETRRGRVGKQIANTLETSCNQGVVIPDWIPDSNDVNNTLRNGGKGSLTAKHNYEHINDGYRIRKLTPMECWRLQGFTDEQFLKCLDAGVSDSQLYKQAGNAVTVNVIYELGSAIKNYLKKQSTLF